MSMQSKSVFFDRDGQEIEQNFGYRGRVSVSIDEFDSGKTQQSHAESCDIHNIIERYDRTGQLPIPLRKGMYGDVSKLNDYYQNVLDDSARTIAEAEAFIKDAQAKAEIAQKEKAKLDAEKAKATSSTDQPASVSAQD